MNIFYNQLLRGFLLCSITWLPSVYLAAQSCPGLGSITLTIVANPTPSINAPAKICPQGSGTLTVAQTYSGYLWSTGETDKSIGISEPGPYSVTVSSAAGCTGTAFAEVLPQDVPFPQITVANDTCKGLVTLNAGAGYPSILWSNGATTSAITVSAAGDYAVTVTNIYGCSGESSSHATVFPPPKVDITGDSSICGGSAAHLHANSPVNAPVYQWSNGQNLADITVNTGGSYFVTVTNQNGCHAIDSVVVSETQVVQPIIVGPAAICAMDSALLTVSNSFNAYAWNNGADTSAVMLDSAGIYSVTVTDNHGCTSTGSYTLIFSPLPDPQLVAAPYACNGLLSLQTDKGYQTYQWSNNASGDSISVNISGTYTVTVTNALGCSATASFTAVVPALPSVAITGQDSICPGSSTTLSVPAGFAQYSWNDGSGGLSLAVNTAGAYAVTVTDQQGCTATNSFAVNTFSAPAPSITGISQICVTGSATFSVAGNYSSYLWSTGEQSASITTSTAGEYTVTVTSVEGCSGTDTHTLSVDTIMQPQILQQPYTCNGLLSLQTDQGYQTYQWSNNASGDSISVNTSGTYTVTVTNALGCSATAAFVADVPLLPTVAIAGQDSICPGSSTTLSVPAGFAQYSWNDGSAGLTLAVNTAGAYAVTVTDQQGCTASNSFAVNTFSSPAPSITGISQICVSGSATFSVAGNYSAYLWSTGEQTASITTSTAGEYTVTVTSVEGCSGTDTHTLSVGANLQPQIQAQPYACNGNVDLDAGAGFATYSWSDGQTSQGISASSPGIYGVTVSDGNGCSGTSSFSVTIPAPPSVEISGNDHICPGQTTTLALSQAFSGYIWSTGAVTAGISISNANTYTVTVTDQLGCTATDEISIQQYAQPAPGIQALPYACDAQLTLNADSGFLQYEWTGPNGFAAGTQQIAVSQDGDYDLVVTDQNGCAGSASFTVNIPVQEFVTVDGPAQVCPGSSASLSAASGFQAYHWSNGGNGATLNVNAAGIYTVTATDALGCSSSATLSLGLFPQPVPDISGPTSACPGAIVTLNVDPSFQSIQWSNGVNGQSISEIPPFSATVTVTDANGCTGTASASVSALTPPNANVDILPYQCDEQLTLDAGAGFTYEWSGPNGFGSTLQQPVVSNAGAYTVTVTDANGCTSSASAQVTIPLSPSLAISGTSPVCPGQQSNLSATAGFISYEWSDGQSGSSVTVTQAGIYSLTSTDANGCTVSASFSIEEAPPLQPAIDGNTLVCPGAAAVFEVQGIYTTYAWSNAEVTSLINVSQPGTYTVSVTDAEGCTGTAEIQLEWAGAPTPGITQQPYHCDQKLTLDAGAGYTTYLWSNGSNSSSIEVSQSGSYAVTVSNAQGCSASADIQTTIPSPLSAAISGISGLCGGSSGAINASASAPGTYQWSSGAQGPDIDVSEAGVYTVTVTDALGCTATQSHTVIALLPSNATMQLSTCRQSDAGTETRYLVAANGCDSILTVVTSYIPENPDLALNLVDELEATIGQTVQLQINGNFAIDSVAFQSPFTLSCSNCVNPTLVALNNGFISVKAFDPDGCATSGEIRIKVNRDLHIYVPNIFQPGSGQNGVFGIYSGAEIQAVRNFHVFDRWGNELYASDSMPTNTPGTGWDGTFRGQAVQPGVYVYYFEVLLADGSVEPYSGDITVIR